MRIAAMRHERVMGNELTLVENRPMTMRSDMFKELPPSVRERAIELMLERNSDLAEHPLTPDKAGEWIDFHVYRENWDAGRVRRLVDNSDHPDIGPHRPTSDHVWPHSDAWIGVRDIDATASVWDALAEVGHDRQSYWRQP
jgi:hypothetical protein